MSIPFNERLLGHLVNQSEPWIQREIFGTLFISYQIKRIGCVATLGGLLLACDGGVRHSIFLKNVICIRYFL